MSRKGEELLHAIIALDEALSLCGFGSEGVRVIVPPHVGPRLEGILIVEDAAIRGGLYRGPRRDDRLIRRFGCGGIEFQYKHSHRRFA